MLGFMLFLPSLWFAPHFFYLIPLLYLFFKNKIVFSKKDMNFLLLTGWIALALCSMLIGIFLGKHQADLSGLFPWFTLILVSFIYAKNLTEKDILILLFLITIEGLVVTLEFFYGVPTLFFATTFKYEDIELLYFRRPYGFGTNSSAAAMNLFIGILLLEYSKINKIKYLIILIVLLMGIIFTFNRTIILAIIIFYIIKFFLSNHSFMYKVFISLLFLNILILSFYQYLDIIVMQFTRDSGHVDLSGREYVWKYYLDFIQNNLLFGNSMEKVWFHYNGRIFHAHNSFLEFFATVGLLLGILYFIILTRHLTRQSFPFIIAIAMSGMTQYSFGWGISLIDIFLFHFAFFLKDYHVK